MSISLTKGQRISLEKSNGSKLNKMCIGVNWGAIDKKGLFGNKKVAVDLDASVGVYDGNGQLIDTVYFRNLKGKGITHSGDDLTGDIDGDDGLDNEVIQINLSELDPRANTLAFVMNSFNRQDFKDIPFASIRIYEGTPSNVIEVFATFDLANDASFAGKVSMIMGRLYKNNDQWKFNSIGESTDDKNLDDTLSTFKLRFL